MRRNENPHEFRYISAHRIEFKSNAERLDDRYTTLSSQPKSPEP